MNAELVAAKAKPSTIWGQKPFVLLLLTSLFLNIGGQIYQFAMPLLMYEMTQSAVMMSNMRIAEYLPNLLLGLIVGVLVDRVNKKRWIIHMIFWQILMLLFYVVLVRTDVQVYFLYYLTGFLLMSFNYGYFNAQVSLTKLLLSREHLIAANAKLSQAETLITILGPVLSGIIFLLARVSDGFLITAGTYALCLLLLLPLPIPHQPAPPAEKGAFVRELKEGWQAFRSNRLLPLLTGFVICLNATMSMVSTTTVFFAKDDLHLSSSMLAWVFAASGLGGLFGSWLTQRYRAKWEIGRLFGISALINAAAYCGFFLCKNVPSLASALLVQGVAIAVYSVCTYTLRHELSPHAYIGRITGITGTLFRTVMPISTAVGAWMVVHWGAPCVFATAAVVNVLLFGGLLKTALWKTR